MNVGIDDNNQSRFGTLGTVAIRSYRACVAFPHPLFSAAAAIGQRFESDPSRFDLDAVQIPSDKGLMSSVLAQDHDLRRFTHPPIRGQSTPPGTNSSRDRRRTSKLAQDHCPPG